MAAEKSLLTRLIERRRAERMVRVAQHNARTNARIAVALFEDKARDGGLLIHRDIEVNGGLA